MKQFIIACLLCLYCIESSGQIKERSRPAEWDKLVEGARFVDRFEPLPAGIITSNTWGADAVCSRIVSNGLEDKEHSYWGGNILKDEQGKYNLFVCGWPENSAKGHMFWPNSTVYHAVSNNSIGPYQIADTIGKGHNPEAFRLTDGRFVVYVIGGYYIANNMTGPWEYRKFEFDTRDRKIIEGLSNLSFAQRQDGSYLMVCRGGGIWISRTGISPYQQITDKRVYPPVAGEFEDPVIWRDHVQYHLIVNDWLGRIAFYMRSKDGIHWVTDPGEAYTPNIVTHEDGQKEGWFKYERIKILQDAQGRAIQANFAVIDTLKLEDLPNDQHSSKNISIPLNPGLLLTMLDAEPIESNSKTIRIRINAETNFNPQKEVDIKSLRFGASSEVNYGRGCRAIKKENEGEHLVVTFDAEGHGITADEFAPKLIGKTKKGKLLFGYAKLPYRSYEEPIVSARKPRIFITESGITGDIEVENYGIQIAEESVLSLYLFNKKEKQLLTTITIPSLKPYQRIVIPFDSKHKLVCDKQYDMIIEIATPNAKKSSFQFLYKIP